MPTTCFIEFGNNLSKVFYAGQPVQGTVHLNLTKVKTIRKGSISIIGEGHTRWTERVSRQRYDHFQKNYVTEYDTVVHTSQETYLHTNTYFIANNDGGHRFTAGSYHYPFEIVLPPNLPTSFNGTYGHIRYKAVVKLDVPSDWLGKSFDTPFTVIKQNNLNLDPRLHDPVAVKELKTFYPCFLLCCFESDPLEIIARIPIGGYVPGQTIDLGVRANNNSDNAVSEFTAELLKKVTYHAHGRRKFEEFVVVKKSMRVGCDVNENKELHENMVVPAIPPSDNTSSGLIQIQYCLRVTGSVSGMHNDPKLELPLVIGTYPLIDQSQSMMPVNSITTQPMVSVNPTAPPLPNQKETSAVPQPSAPGFVQFPNCEPPNYEDAMRFGEPSDTEFTPKYPVFKQQAVYSNHI